MKEVEKSEVRKAIRELRKMMREIYRSRELTNYVVNELSKRKRDRPFLAFVLSCLKELAFQELGKDPAIKKLVEWQLKKDTILTKIKDVKFNEDGSVNITFESRKLVRCYGDKKVS